MNTNYLNVISNKKRIFKLFKYMLKMREYFYVEVDSAIYEDCKVPISIIDISNGNIELRVSDLNALSKDLKEITILSNFKNIEFNAAIISNNNGHLVVSMPDTIFVRELRLTKRESLIINSNILNEESTINFQKQGQKDKKPKRSYLKRIIDISDRGMAITVSVLEPDLFELGDTLLFRLPEDLSHVMGNKYKGIIKHLSRINKNKIDGFSKIRLWVEFQSVS